MILILVPILIFGLGLLIGSFLNVVILRMNTGRSVVTGRSKCATCARELNWYELIPVFSFVALRGRCRTCKNDISFQYALVEILTAISFMMAYIKILVAGNFTSYALISFVFTLIITCLLVVIFVYDVKHKIIPDKIVFPFILLSLAAIVWKGFTLPGFLIGNAVINGVYVALPFFLLWFLSKGRFMGFGDVKLALGIGWLLGLYGGFAAILLSFWIGGAVGLFLMAISRKYKMSSQIPFGPFLILGVFIVGLWGVTISNIFPIWP